MLSRRYANSIVLLAYAAISFGYFGWPLLPHPGRALVGSTADPATYIWSFGWWPHALGSWTNPFVTHALYAPSGANLTWTAWVPGLAIAFSPITVLFGPVVAYNLASLLMPALAAWTAYLLCRYLTGSVWASLVGGYLFGFSASVLRDQLWGNLHVTAVFLLPLIALVVIRYLRDDLSARGLAWRLGPLIALQFWISTELVFTATFVLVLGLLLGLWFAGDARGRIRASIGPIAASYALAAVLSAPLLVFVLLGFVSESVIEGQSDAGDLLNFVVPTRSIAIGGSSFASLTNRLPSEGGGVYLGLPVLLILVLSAVRARRAVWARFLIAGLVVTAVLELGPELLVDGRRIFALPWDALNHLPGFRSAFAFRFSMFSSLAAAVLVAFWTATTRGRIFSRPYVLPALAVIALVPAFWQPFFHGKQQHVAFFSDASYKTCIGRNETVAILPLAGNSLVWQAETGFWFKVAGDGIAPFPLHGKPLNSFDAERIVWDLTYATEEGQPTTGRLLAFAARHHISRFLSVPSSGYPTEAQMKQLGPTELVGGMLVSPACGTPPLTTRDLASYVQSDPHVTINSAPSIGYCAGTNFTELAQGLVPAGQLAGARRAIYVAGQGLTCAAPPSGYKRHGFATVAMSVPADTYALYSP